MMIYKFAWTILPSLCIAFVLIVLNFLGRPVLHRGCMQDRAPLTSLPEKPGQTLLDQAEEACSKMEADDTDGADMLKAFWQLLHHHFWLHSFCESVFKQSVIFSKVLIISLLCGVSAQRSLQGAATRPEVSAGRDWRGWGWRGSWGSRQGVEGRARPTQQRPRKR